MSRMCIDSRAGTKEIPPRGRNNTWLVLAAPRTLFGVAGRGHPKAKNNPLANSAALPRGALNHAISCYRPVVGCAFGPHRLLHRSKGGGSQERRQRAVPAAGVPRGQVAGGSQLVDQSQAS